MTRPTIILCSVMLLFLVGYNIFLPLSPDEAYYWDWSRHLAWSYYDGPPMIAYLIRVFTICFGTSAFVVKSVSVVCCLLTGWLAYHFARRLFGVAVAEKTIVLLLFMPLAQVAFMVTTYDSPLCLFWMVCLYSGYLALTEEKPGYFYLAGLSAGLMLLSKFTGVLLLASLFFYVLQFKRALFKNTHLYLAILLAFILFTPVLIWNRQHQWLSFAMQWHHGVASHPVFSWKLFGNFMSGQLGIFNPIFFALFVFLSIKYRDVIKNNKALLYLLYAFLIPWLFFLYNACFQRSEANWPAPAYLSGTILLAYLIERDRCIKIYKLGIAVAIVAIIFLKLPWIYSFYTNKHVAAPIARNFFGYPALIGDAASLYPKNAILVGDYHRNIAEADFYLPNHPYIYQIPSWIRDSQYTLWSQAMIADIEQGRVKDVWYIGGTEGPHIMFLQTYFKQCVIVKRLGYHGQFNDRKLMVMHCMR